MIILYSNHCPRCAVLEKKLNEANIEYTLETDMEVMLEKGFSSAPMLEVEGDVMDFSQALKWLKGGA